MLICWFSPLTVCTKKTGINKASLKEIDGYFFGIEFARSDLGLVGNYRF
jgi:hypothetical protein